MSTMSENTCPKSISFFEGFYPMPRLIHGDCLEVFKSMQPQFDCIFADPPDNIRLGYYGYEDDLSEKQYRSLLYQWVEHFTLAAPVVWISFNARWTLAMARVMDRFIELQDDWEFKPFVQTFTFGQNNRHDCGNGHRPLWRLKHTSAPLYPDAIKVPSWRQQNGDKRAAPGGRVPLDVWDFPRVTGNSKQRRSWHPTQLNEGLVERAILLSTQPGDSVCDPFGGTGTTLRVCKRLERDCTLIEASEVYCDRIQEEHQDIERRSWT